MAAMGSAYLENEQAAAFVADLRKAEPTAVGDEISAALRAVAQAEQPVTIGQVRRAVAALALLLSSFDQAILDGVPDAPQLRSWFQNLEIELNPARRQVAGAAIERILLPADNEWYDGPADRADGTAGVVGVHRLRAVLADAAADE